MLHHGNCHSAASCQEANQGHPPLHPFIVNDLMSPNLTPPTYQPNVSVLWMDQQLRERRERAAYRLAQQSCIHSTTQTPESTTIPYLPERLDHTIKSYVVSPQNPSPWQSPTPLQSLLPFTPVTHASVVAMPFRNHSHLFGTSDMVPNSPVSQNESPSEPLHSSTHEESIGGQQQLPEQPRSVMDYLHIESYMGDTKNQEPALTAIKLRPRKRVCCDHTLEADCRSFLTFVA